MKELFRGWKRRLGVGTLALACLFAMAWIRSYLLADVIEYTSGKYSQEEFQSVDGNLEWWTDQFFDESSVPFDVDPSFRWNDSTTIINYYGNHFRLHEIKMEWTLWWPGGGIGNAPASVVGNDSRRLRFVSYWSIVLPLTLLSGWLLLSKPRPSKTKADSEP